MLVFLHGRAVSATVLTSYLLAALFPRRVLTFYF